MSNEQQRATERLLQASRQNSVENSGPGVGGDRESTMGRAQGGITERPRGNNARGASGPTTQGARGCKSRCWSEPSTTAGVEGEVRDDSGEESSDGNDFADETVVNSGPGGRSGRESTSPALSLGNLIEYELDWEECRRVEHLNWEECRRVERLEGFDRNVRSLDLIDCAIGSRTWIVDSRPTSPALPGGSERARRLRGGERRRKQLRRRDGFREFRRGRLRRRDGFRGNGRRWGGTQRIRNIMDVVLYGRLVRIGLRVRR